MRAATIRGLSRSPTAGVFSEVNEAFTPRSLPNLAAWFDALDTRTMLSGDGATITDGGSVALWSDKSGNSGVNCLITNGLTGNYCSVADGAYLDLGATFCIEVDSALNDWTPAALNDFLGRYVGTGDKRSYLLRLQTTGVLSFIMSTNGTAGTVTQHDSTVAPTVSDYGRLRFRFYKNAAVGQFWVSSDGTNWSKLGNDLVTPAGAPFANDIGMNMASVDGVNNGLNGRLYAVKIYSDFGSTVVFDSTFSTAGKKLANGDTFVCATGQTVTLNSSGATGARIAGERDWFQGTAGSRGTFNLAGHYVSTDGTDDYYKTPLLSLPQPVTLYAVLEQTTWTSGDYLFDGSASDTLALIQTTSTPQINLSAGSSVAANTDLAVETKALVTIVSNGVSSLVSINRLPATTGNAGAGVPNGLTLASKGTAGSYGNARYYEIAVYRAAHDQATRHRFALYAARKWGFAV